MSASRGDRPSISLILYDLRGTPKNNSLWEVRRKILPLRRRIIGALSVLLSRNRNSPDWELCEDVAKSRSSQEIEEAFLTYHALPQRLSAIADLVLGRPSLSRTLKFYRHLKGELSAKQKGKSVAGFAPITRTRGEQ